MRVLYDANVVLDVLLGRQPHFAESAACMALVAHRKVDGVLCATSITTIHYLTGRSLGAPAALRAVCDLLALYAIAPVDATILRQAAFAPLTDYEDAVQHASAMAAGAGCIVTRDAHGLTGCQLPVYSPAQFLALMDKTHE